jgi:hypothetical protein
MEALLRPRALGRDQGKSHIRAADIAKNNRKRKFHEIYPERRIEQPFGRRIAGPLSLLQAPTGPNESMNGAKQSCYVVARSELTASALPASRNV